MMKHQITRRQAIKSLAAFTTGALFKPSSIFGAEPVKDRFRFGIIGDWGTGCEDGTGIARQMLSMHSRTPLDFVIAAGDNIYPNGSGRYFSKHFERPFARFLAERINFYAVLGNHDVREGRSDQCQYPLFNMGGKCYYTLKQGDGLLEFFMVDSTDFDSTQAGWLEKSLSASTARWKIAVFHHPIYSSGKKHGSDLDLRKKIEPLLVRYGVSVAFSGHDHIYERIHPQQGIQYFVTGAGGKTRRGGIDLNSPIRAASFDEDNHFMVVEVDNRQMSYQAISETNTVIDHGVCERV
jgi:3',5'-cyclic AMP phosphodiesterase CpdA